MMKRFIILKLDSLQMKKQHYLYQRNIKDSNIFFLAIAEQVENRARENNSIIIIWKHQI